MKKRQDSANYFELFLKILAIIHPLAKNGVECYVYRYFREDRRNSRRSGQRISGRVGAFAARISPGAVRGLRDRIFFQRRSARSRQGGVCRLFRRVRFRLCRARSLRLRARRSRTRYFIRGRRFGRQSGVSGAVRRAVAVSQKKRADQSPPRSRASPNT